MPFTTNLSNLYNVYEKVLLIAQEVLYLTKANIRFYIVSYKLNNAILSQFLLQLVIYDDFSGKTGQNTQNTFPLLFG